MLEIDHFHAANLKFIFSFFLRMSCSLILVLHIRRKCGLSKQGYEVNTSVCLIFLYYLVLITFDSSYNWLKFCGISLAVKLNAQTQLSGIHNMKHDYDTIMHHKD